LNEESAIGRSKENRKSGECKRKPQRERKNYLLNVDDNLHLFLLVVRSSLFLSLTLRGFLLCGDLGLGRLLLDGRFLLFLDLLAGLVGFR